MDWSPLEMWVHIEPSPPLDDHVHIWAEIPDDVQVLPVDTTGLPEGMEFCYHPVRVPSQHRERVVEIADLCSAKGASCHDSRRIQLSAQPRA
jgi:hypothetical protein